LITVYRAPKGLRTHSLGRCPIVGYFHVRKDIGVNRWIYALIFKNESELFTSRHTPLLSRFGSDLLNVVLSSFPVQFDGGSYALKVAESLPYRTSSENKV
jgi:hypothetical protein